MIKAEHNGNEFTIEDAKLTTKHWYIGEAFRFVSMDPPPTHKGPMDLALFNLMKQDYLPSATLLEHKPPFVEKGTTF